MSLKNVLPSTSRVLRTFLLLYYLLNYSYIVIFSRLKVIHLSHAYHYFVFFLQKILPVCIITYCTILLLIHGLLSVCVCVCVGGCGWVGALVV